MAVEIAINTNRYRDFVDGESRAVAMFWRAPKIYLPLVVAAELRAGFAAGGRANDNARIFEQFLHRPRVDLLLPTLETTRHYATLFKQLRSAGTPIPTTDLWKAALVLQYDISLYSRDSHFDLIPQLPRAM